MRPGASWVLQEGQAGLGFAIFEGSRDRLLRAPEAQTLSAQALFVGYACVASLTAASLAAEPGPPHSDCIFPDRIAT